MDKVGKVKNVEVAPLCRNRICKKMDWHSSPIARMFCRLRQSGNLQEEHEQGKSSWGVNKVRYPLGWLELTLCKSVSDNDCKESGLD
jgi:hypothetical protein